MGNLLNKRALKLVLTIFFAGAFLILFYFMVADFGAVLSAIRRFNDIIAPFIYGLIMAYLLCPIFNAITRFCYAMSVSSMRTKKNAFVFSRVVATVICLIILIVIIGGFLALLIPQIIRSIVGIIDVMPERMATFNSWVTDVISNSGHPEIIKWLKGGVEGSYDTFMKWASDNLIPGVGSMMTKVSNGIIMTVKTALNMLIGIIICVYFLNSKERFRAQSKKIITALCRKERADGIYEFGHCVNKTFGGFISGKIIDSFIIGIICFVVMIILKLPYSVLISTIIGVTNIIPFFGPFIGAIPCAIIIFIMNPIQAGIFVIMVFCLQQFDGNILGPKILGNSIGLASFWVMFSIIFFGGLFGVIGMVLGVPVFAIIYYYFKKFIERKLFEKGMPTETITYQDYNVYDVNRKDVL